MSTTITRNQEIPQAPQPSFEDQLITDVAGLAVQNGGHIEFGALPPQPEPAPITIYEATGPSRFNRLTRKVAPYLAALAIGVGGIPLVEKGVAAIGNSAAQSIDYGPTKSENFGKAAAAQKYDNSNR